MFRALFDLTFLEQLNLKFVHKIFNQSDKTNKYKSSKNFTLNKNARDQRKTGNQHGPAAATRGGSPHGQPPGEARQPTSLQGLLRFAMEATKAEDAPHDSEYQPMDEERKKFLEAALKSLTVDVVQELQKQIQILQRVEQAKPEDEVKEFEQALETILEYVDQIDTANDFHKIGGFMVLYPCLKSVHPSVRAGGCELLATLCQNNLYCQQVVLDNEFVPKLLSIIEKDEDIQVVVKALYALSGIVRDNPEGFNQLIHYNGLVILLNTLKRNNEKFITKTAFLLSALCRQHPDMKSRLVFLDYIPALVQLVATERSASHEHVLSLLVSLVEENPTAVAECRNPRYNLKDVLQKYVASIRNREECLEEEQYCKRLLHLLSS
ncbi:hypothetical protein NQ315_000126 [Exocentrus adspersus]|uniref:Nucleotide exchange factor Fes1 domain-containing protein n=1 Tax=Exocentrus adspersus TaxID=1586481 RepID=A0AAV8VR71_9CUCU|nr:hypothetical protein NQ315_000126 [Exocentrus adspersus]